MTGFIAYLWLGLVLGVSFLATPIKFRAESLTLPVALDVGRVTFHAFGRVEWVLVVALAVAIGTQSETESADWFLPALVAAIVVAQAVWLIPRLDLRVEAVIAGTPPPPSRLHLIYVAFEATKAIALLLIGIRAWTAVSS